MKSYYTRVKSRLAAAISISFCLLLLNGVVQAQTDSAAPAKKADAPANPRPVKNTFQSQWIIDNQTVMVPVKGSLEMDFQHRFGVLGKGYQDFYGVFSPSFNIRFGATYTPIKNLSVGIGFTKTNLLWDASAKYAIFTQTPGKYPVSLTFFGDMAVNTVKDAVLYDGSEIQHNSDRYSFFSSLIVARKVSDKLSVQLTGSVSWQNAVGGYYTKIDSTGNEIYQSMWNYHIAIAVSARYRISDVTAIIFDYDQPLTKHPSYNPTPNLGLGFEFATSGHAFQLFVTNYSLLSPQNNNLHNSNAPFSYTDKATGTPMPGGQWLIGFNITRLWNY
jgi:hypothetical protein